MLAMLNAQWPMAPISAHATNARNNTSNNQKIMYHKKNLFSTIVSLLIGILIGRTSMNTISPRTAGGLESETGKVAASTPSTTTTRIPTFYEVAKQHQTDKVMGPSSLEHCSDEKEHILCPKRRADAVNPRCRIVGHFYHDLYQRWLGSYAAATSEPFQMLEIGVGQGRSIPVWEQWLPHSERHHMDAVCTPTGLPKQSAKLKKIYQDMLDKNRMHCGDSSNFEFLHETYKTMRRPDAPPLRVVVEDASHIPKHMAAAVFFWLPRIESGGLLFLEDIEPNVSTKHMGHGIQTDLMPQLINDVHYCGDPEATEPPACFSTIQPLIKSVHCDLHICVIERNDVPASDPPKEVSVPPANALDAKQCLVRP